MRLGLGLVLMGGFQKKNEMVKKKEKKRNLCWDERACRAQLGLKLWRVRDGVPVWRRVEGVRSVKRRGWRPTVEELIEQLAPDLQGLLDARKVGRQTQADLAKIGVDSIAMLSAIAINREGLEKVAKDMLSIDVAGGGGDEQIKFAQLYLAWQAATKRVKVQDEMDAEASAQKEPKPVPPQELTALRQKFEAEFYKLKDAEVPSKASMEDLFEQIDLGEFRPMALRHFGSRADNEEAEVGNLHVAKSGQVKIRKSRVETTAPVTLEDFRAKVILMANHYLFARFRYPNKQLLQKINPFTFLDYLGCLTGKHVAQMETQTVDGVTLHRPSVKLLVNYEYQMRKEVVEEMNQGGCMAEELKKVTKNSDVRERHFSTPLAVSSISGPTLMTKKKEKERVRRERGPCVSHLPGPQSHHLPTSTGGEEGCSCSLLTITRGDASFTDPGFAGPIFVCRH